MKHAAKTLLIAPDDASPKPDGPVRRRGASNWQCTSNTPLSHTVNVGLSNQSLLRPSKSLMTAFWSIVLSPRISRA